MKDSDEIRIGLMPPLSGLVEMYGREIQRAAEITVREINREGGILGRPLKLIVEDDGSLPESAVAAAERLVHQHKCSALVGNLLSNSRIAVAYRVAEPNRIPLLNFSFYEGSIRSRYFFHFAALPNQQIEQMIPYMKNRFGGKMFFAGNNYEWPRGSIDAAKRALVQCGGEVLDELYLPIGASKESLDRLLERLSQSQADVFVPYFAGKDQMNLLQKFNDLGLKKRMAVVTGHFDEMLASQMSPEVREGFFSSNTYFMSVPNDENRRFLQSLSEWPGVTGIWPEGNGILTNFGEGAILCIKAFVKAITKTKSLDSELLVRALETVEVEGPQGTIKMDFTSHHARVNTYLTQCQRDGTFRIVESFGAIAPRIPERYAHLRVGAAMSTDQDVRLQARIVDQMSEAVFLVETSQRKIVFTNSGFDRLFGLAPGEMLGQTLEQLNTNFGAAGANSLSEINKQLYSRGLWMGEIQAQRKDGQKLWCSASASAFTHEKYGEVWMAVFHDVTEIHEKQELIEKQQAELLQASKMSALGEMAAGIAHEINNPLAIISGIANRIRGQVDRGALDQGKLTLDLQKINGMVLRIDKIIKGLKAFSRNAESDQMALVDLAQLTDETIELARERFGKLGVELRWKPTMGIQVECRGSEISQCILNLLNNSCDAIEGLDEKWISISLKESGDWVILEIMDSGSGIPEEIVPKMMQPFYTTKAIGKGTGLGLSITRGLIEGHRGSLNYDHRDGHTRFTIQLPKRHSNNSNI